MAEAKKKTTKAKAVKEAELVAEATPVTETEVITEEVTETPAEAEVEVTEEVKATAKAGKRSTKGIKEAEEKAVKEERKAHATEAKADDAEAKPKQAAAPVRTRLERKGKKFRELAKLLEADKAYTLDEAVELAGKTSPVKFDATVELHINLSVDPRQADQNIRDSLVLPAGTGKTVRIALLDDTKIEGVEISGVDAVLQALDKGEINFDILIATPAQMPKLGKYARVLGPRGLMPNPKSGTVTSDVAKAVADSKAGRVEYRVDSTGIVHLGVGKASFTKAQLLSNVEAVLASIKANKPASVKSAYIKAIHLSTSMGPSIKVDPANIA